MLAEPGRSRRLVQLRRLVDERERSLHRLLDLRPDDRCGCSRRHAEFNATTDLYNFGPLNYYQRPERRYSLGANGHYEFGEHADVYTQLSYTDYESVAQIAPSGNFFEYQLDQLRQPAAARQHPADDRLRRWGDCRGRLGDDVHRPAQRRRRWSPAVVREHRLPRGCRRPWLDQRGLGYDASAQSRRAPGRRRRSTTSWTERAARALNVHDVNGVPTCQSVIDGSDPACVPWNVFTPGGVTQDQLAYLQAAGLQIGRINQEIYNGVITGDLGAYGIKLPTASDGIQV
jgi:hypothetical protein